MVQNQEKEKNKPKLLSPKVDIIFQILFGEVGSEIITKKFLEAILNKKIESVDLSQNIVMRHENIGEKMGVLDVLVKFDDKKSNHLMKYFEMTCHQTDVEYLEYV